MRILLDTHTFLWWNMDDRRLPKRVRRSIADPANELLFSAASAWELAIKVRRGILHLPEPVQSYVPARLAHYGIAALPVSVAHTLETASLPLHHADPFDRLLVAQCRVEGLRIATSDAAIERYGVDVLW